MKCLHLHVGVERLKDTEIFSPSSIQADTACGEPTLLATSKSHTPEQPTSGCCS